MTAAAENSGETGGNVADAHDENGHISDGAPCDAGAEAAAVHAAVVLQNDVTDEYASGLGAGVVVACSGGGVISHDAIAPNAVTRDAVTREVCRGVGRLLRAMSFAVVNELVLPNGRRADVVGLSPSGAIWIVEVKSCADDFRVDQKWPEYMEFADALFFAVSPRFPQELLPAGSGLMLADRYGGEIVRDAPEERLAAARRKAMTLRFARAAAFSLQMLADPGIEHA